MNRRYGLAIIGADARTRALAERLAPESPFHHGPFAITAWAGSPAGGDSGEVASQARVAGVAVGAAWREALGGGTDAVLVAGPVAGRAAAVAAALRAGKAVLCPVPFAVTAAEVADVEAAQRSSGALLLAPSDLSASLAGRRALASVQAGELGPLHAVFLASRAPRLQLAGDGGGGSDPDVLGELGWEALDYLAACIGAPCEHAYATGGRLFGVGGGLDTVLGNLRFAGDTIATLELARSLPTAIASAGPEVEVELAGTDAALRVEPYRRVVEVLGAEPAATAERRHWPARPVIEMLEDLQAAMEGGAERAPTGVFERQRAVLAMHAALRASLERRDAVAVGG